MNDWTLCPIHRSRFPAGASCPQCKAAGRPTPPPAWLDPSMTIRNGGLFGRGDSGLATFAGWMIGGMMIGVASALAIIEAWGR